jgi:cytochrome c-type biogenesis protein CcmH
VKQKPIALAAAAAAAAALAVLSITSAAAMAAPAPKTSLTAVEADVMCVSCRESLAVAQSPQAYAERAFIRTLVAQGYDKRQIEQALVAQYGPAVLGKPPARGFNLTVYVLPPALVLIGIVTLALVLPRWRRRTGAKGRTAASDQAPSITPQENARLEQELAHFDG